MDRARAIYELAIAQPVLDMPELLWKSYIDVEVEQVGSGRRGRQPGDRGSGGGRGEEGSREMEGGGGAGGGEDEGASCGKWVATGNGRMQGERERSGGRRGATGGGAQGGTG